MGRSTSSDDHDIVVPGSSAAGNVPVPSTNSGTTLDDDKAKDSSGAAPSKSVVNVSKLSRGLRQRKEDWEAKQAARSSGYQVAGFQAGNGSSKGTHTPATLHSSTSLGSLALDSVEIDVDELIEESRKQSQGSVSSSLGGDTPTLSRGLRRTQEEKDTKLATGSSRSATPGATSIRSSSVGSVSSSARASVRSSTTSGLHRTQEDLEAKQAALVGIKPTNARSTSAGSVASSARAVRSSTTSGLQRTREDLEAKQAALGIKPTNARNTSAGSVASSARDSVCSSTTSGLRRTQEDLEAKQAALGTKPTNARNTSAASSGRSVCNSVGSSTSASAASTRHSRGLRQTKNRAAAKLAANSQDNQKPEEILEPQESPMPREPTRAFFDISSGSVRDISSPNLDNAGSNMSSWVDPFDPHRQETDLAQDQDADPSALSQDRDTEPPQQQSSVVPDTDLVTARPVEEEDDPEDIPDAMHWDEEENAKAAQERRCQGNVKVLKALGIGAILVIVVALAIALTKKGDGSTAAYVPASTSNASAAPSAPAITLEQHFLSLLPNATAEAALLNETGSPQAKALEWLLLDPYATTYSDMRLVQRFVLATIFYSTGGEDKWRTEWKDDDGKKHTLDHWMSYEKHECDWALAGLNDEIFFDDTNGTDDTAGMRHPMPASPCASQVTQTSDGAEYTYETLWLSNLKLVGESIPQETFMLTSLKVLNLQNNKISGSIPTELGLLTNLEVLSLAGNPLTGSLPTEIGICSNLVTINLRDHELSGQIPLEIANLKQLEYVLLDSSGINGTLPPLPESVLEVDLSENGLTGSIPTEIGLASNLEYLFVDRNFFTGDIPTEVGLLTSLIEIRAYSNHFSGTIPSEIGGLSSAEIAELDDNPGLLGPIPSELGLLTSLHELLLHTTNVSSTIPSEIGSMAMLETLGLYYTAISGAIPSEIVRLTNLVVLHLDSNFLSMTIPTEFGNFVALEVLHLYHNELSGELPSEIGLISNLTDFDVSGNYLTGQIPQEVAPLLDNEHLFLFNLSGNSFTGVLPEELCMADDVFDFDCGTELCGCTCVCSNATG